MHSEHSERINPQSFRVTNRPPIAHFRTTVSPLSVRMTIRLSHCARPQWRSRLIVRRIMHKSLETSDAALRPTVKTTFVADRETATAVNYADVVM